MSTKTILVVALCAFLLHVVCALIEGEFIKRAIIEADVCGFKEACATIAPAVVPQKKGFLKSIFGKSTAAFVFEDAVDARLSTFAISGDIVTYFNAFLTFDGVTEEDLLRPLLESITEGSAVKAEFQTTNVDLANKITNYEALIANNAAAAAMQPEAFAVAVANTIDFLLTSVDFWRDLLSKFRTVFNNFTHEFLNVGTQLASKRYTATMFRENMLTPINMDRAIDFANAFARIYNNNLMWIGTYAKMWTNATDLRLNYWTLNHSDAVRTAVAMLFPQIAVATNATQAYDLLLTLCLDEAFIVLTYANYNDLSNAALANAATNLETKPWYFPYAVRQNPLFFATNRQVSLHPNTFLVAFFPTIAQVDIVRRMLKSINLVSHSYQMANDAELGQLAFSLQQLMNHGDLFLEKMLENKEYFPDLIRAASNPSVTAAIILRFFELYEQILNRPANMVRYASAVNSMLFVTPADIAAARSFYQTLSPPAPLIFGVTAPVSPDQFRMSFFRAEKELAAFSNFFIANYGSKLLLDKSAFLRLAFEIFRQPISNIMTQFMQNDVCFRIVLKARLGTKADPTNYCKLIFQPQLYAEMLAKTYSLYEHDVLDPARKTEALITPLFTKELLLDRICRLDRLFGHNRPSGSTDEYVVQEIYSRLTKPATLEYSEANWTSILQTINRFLPACTGDYFDRLVYPFLKGTSPAENDEALSLMRVLTNDTSFGTSFASSKKTHINQLMKMLTAEFWGHLLKAIDMMFVDFTNRDPTKIKYKVLLKHQYLGAFRNSDFSSPERVFASLIERWDNVRVFVNAIFKIQGVAPAPFADRWLLFTTFMSMLEAKNQDALAPLVYTYAFKNVSPMSCITNDERNYFNIVAGCGLEIATAVQQKVVDDKAVAADLIVRLQSLATVQLSMTGPMFVTSMGHFFGVPDISTHRKFDLFLRLSEFLIADRPMLIDSDPTAQKFFQGCVLLFGLQSAASKAEWVKKFVSKTSFFKDTVSAVNACRFLSVEDFAAGKTLQSYFEKSDIMGIRAGRPLLKATVDYFFNGFDSKFKAFLGDINKLHPALARCPPTDYANVFSALIDVFDGAKTKLARSIYMTSSGFAFHATFLRQLTPKMTEEQFTQAYLQHVIERFKQLFVGEIEELKKERFSLLYTRLAGWSIPLDPPADFKLFYDSLVAMVKKNLVAPGAVAHFEFDPSMLMNAGVFVKIQMKIDSFRLVDGAYPGFCGFTRTFFRNFNDFLQFLAPVTKINAFLVDANNAKTAAQLAKAIASTWYNESIWVSILKCLTDAKIADMVHFESGLSIASSVNVFGLWDFIPALGGARKPISYFKLTSFVASLRAYLPASTKIDEILSLLKANSFFAATIAEKISYWTSLMRQTPTEENFYVIFEEIRTEILRIFPDDKNKDRNQATLTKMASVKTDYEYFAQIFSRLQPFGKATQFNPELISSELVAVPILKCFETLKKFLSQVAVATSMPGKSWSEHYALIIAVISKPGVAVVFDKDPVYQRFLQSYDFAISDVKKCTAQLVTAFAEVSGLQSLIFSLGKLGIAWNELLTMSFETPLPSHIAFRLNLLSMPHVFGQPVAFARNFDIKSVWSLSASSAEIADLYICHSEDKQQIVHFADFSQRLLIEITNEQSVAIFRRCNALQSYFSLLNGTDIATIYGPLLNAALLKELVCEVTPVIPQFLLETLCDALNKSFAIVSPLTAKQLDVPWAAYRQLLAAYDSQFRSTLQPASVSFYEFWTTFFANLSSLMHILQASERLKEFFDTFFSISDVSLLKRLVQDALLNAKSWSEIFAVLKRAEVDSRDKLATGTAFTDSLDVFGAKTGDKSTSQRIPFFAYVSFIEGIKRKLPQPSPFTDRMVLKLLETHSKFYHQFAPEVTKIMASSTAADAKNTALLEAISNVCDRSMNFEPAKNANVFLNFVTSVKEFSTATKLIKNYTPFGFKTLFKVDFYEDWLVKNQAETQTLIDALFVEIDRIILAVPLFAKMRSVTFFEQYLKLVECCNSSKYLSTYFLFPEYFENAPEKLHDPAEFFANVVQPTLSLNFFREVMLLVARSGLTLDAFVQNVVNAANVNPLVNYRIQLLKLKSIFGKVPDAQKSNDFVALFNLPATSHDFLTIKIHLAKGTFCSFNEFYPHFLKMLEHKDVCNELANVALFADYLNACAEETFEKLLCPLLQDVPLMNAIVKKFDDLFYAPEDMAAIHKYSLKRFMFEKIVGSKIFLACVAPKIVVDVNAHVNLVAEGDFDEQLSMLEAYFVAAAGEDFTRQKMLFCSVFESVMNDRPLWYQFELNEYSLKSDIVEFYCEIFDIEHWKAYLRDEQIESQDETPQKFLYNNFVCDTTVLLQPNDDEANFDEKFDSLAETFKYYDAKAQIEKVVPIVREFSVELGCEDVVVVMNSILQCLRDAQFRPFFKGCYQLAYFNTHSDASVQDVRNFYEKFFAPSNWELMIDILRDNFTFDVETRLFVLKKGVVLPPREPKKPSKDKSIRKSDSVIGATFWTRETIYKTCGFAAMGTAAVAAVLVAIRLSAAKKRASSV